ncbi:MAG: hypothetical protein ABFR89_01550 [Actinomycetota bacterium]
MPHWYPTDDDYDEARRRLLSGLAAGGDLFDLADSLAELHRKNNTFPGEVFMWVGADVLEIAGATRDVPLQYESMIKTRLPEGDFRARQRGRIQHAALMSASLRGGLEPDLLDEEIWRHGDDEYWFYALCATVALIRASAELLAISDAETVARLADRYGITLD